MREIRWSRVLLGIILGIVMAVLGLGLIIGLLVAFSPAQTVQDVQALPRFSFVSSMMVALGCAWGVFVATRSLSSGHVVHGILIALGVGLLYSLATPGSFIANLLTMLMAVLLAVFASRMAQLNPRRSSEKNESIRS